MFMPQLLRPGDLVAITAASGPCDAKRLERGVKAVEGMGLRVRVMDSCYSRHGYFAGTDALRLSDLHHAFADKEARGIFMARGGYGAGRLLGGLDFALIKRNPKVFVGYSDVTALHIALNQFCKLITFHGPMPAADFGEEADENTINALRRMVFDGGLRDENLSDLLQSCPIVPQAPKAAFLCRQIVPGRAAGRLVGGNLTLIAASLGTPYEIKTRGHILFIEETQEEPYRIDRLFLQLKQAGKLSEAAGLVLGDFSPAPAGGNIGRSSNLGRNTLENLETLDMAIKELIVPLAKPTVGGLNCGHISPTITLPLGQQAYIRESEHQPETHARFGIAAEHTRHYSPYSRLGSLYRRR